MSAHGPCSWCNVLNDYKYLVWQSCGARLPWANTVSEAARLRANLPEVSSTPSTPETAMGAFLRSPWFRLVILAVLLLVALFTYFAVDAAVTNQMADAMTQIGAPKSQTAPLAP